MSGAVLPLLMVSAGKEVILVSLDGGLNFRRRLTDMGLAEGARFKVLHSQGPGQCIVRVGNTRLAIGCGMAQKIMVREA